MKSIRVVVQGALGKVGQEVVRAVFADPQMKLVGGIEMPGSKESLVLPDGSTAPLSSDAGSLLMATKPDVLVDFSIARATMPAVKIAAQQQVNLVIGTTGLSNEDIKAIDEMARANQIGAVVASNFALGAILMIHLAKIVGRYMDHAEIIELHHDRKADAPSGTALSTAKAMLAARGKSFLSPSGQAEVAPSRGQHTDGISIHSIRLPGLLAHQEVIFGGAGQTLSIRHDTISRECYAPGVLFAIREVTKRKGLVYGLDTLLGL